MTFTASRLFRPALALLAAALAAPAVADLPSGHDTRRQDVAPQIVVRSATTDVALLESDQHRLAAKILDCLASTAAGSTHGGSPYRVEVAITSYDKGNTYVRSMVSGVASVHADLAVTLVSRADGRIARQIKLSQDFEPTVVSSSNSRIDDIEDALALTVASAVRKATVRVPG